MAGYGSSTQPPSLKDLVVRLKKETESDLEGNAVIGIDFGTTYSGIAWATSADLEANHINQITTWPGTGREESKAPTEVSYDHDRVIWGYSIPPDVKPIRWFKLLLLQEKDLDPEIQVSEILLDARKRLTEANKTVVDVIADYLGALWSHVLGQIERARSKSVLEALAFHVVLTVPAIWPDYARRDMKEAARKAGILDDRLAGPTTLSFAPEPEAAALASLLDRGPYSKTGEVYMVCDAGGGTADLISYKISALDPVQLSEAVVGTGGLCGGVFIDEAFEAMCRSRLGPLWNNLSQSGITELMRQEWEHGIKPQFKIDGSSREYIVCIPAEAFSGMGATALNDFSRKPVIKNGRIHFTRLDIQSAFDNVFENIQYLIDNQILEASKKDLKITGIILVGGLGSSPYLYQYLDEEYTDQGIEILQSTGIRPRTAICRGAIFKGLLDLPTSKLFGTSSQTAAPVSVVTTIARKSLGILFRTPFVEGKHQEEDKAWDALEGIWYADCKMKWYLRKGNDVATKGPKRHAFSRTYSDAKHFARNGRKESLCVWECAEDTPPSRRTSSVNLLCRVDIDMASTATLADYLAPNGRHLKHLIYDIEMVPSGASYEFAIYHGGKRFGGGDVAIDFQ